MKKIVLPFKSVFLFFLLSASMIGCRVTLLPDFDEQIADHIEATAKQVDHFYLTMMETTSNKNKERAYQNFTAGYVEIEVELNALLLKNQVRPLNENSTKISELALELWIKYKEEHKADNELSNGLIKLNRLYMRDIFYAMQVSEQGKNFINNQE